MRNGLVLQYEISTTKRDFIKILWILILLQFQNQLVVIISVNATRLEFITILLW